MNPNVPGRAAGGRLPLKDRRRRFRRRRVAATAIVATIVSGSALGLIEARAEMTERARGPDAPTAAAHARPTRAPTRPAASTPGSASASPTLPTHPPGPIPGYLLIADRGNSRLVLVDSRKRLLWTYPRPGVTPALPFNFDDDAFFGPGFRSIISNQEEQQTIQVVSFPGGRLRWSYGHLDVRGTAPGYLSTPDDAYLRSDGTRTVADIRNCRVLFISPSGQVVRQIGTTGVCGHDPPRLLGQPNGDTPLPGGGTLVTEISGSWVDGFGPTGALLWSFRAPVAYPSDAQWLGDGEVLLADYSSPGHIEIVSTAGRVLWEYGPTSGPGALSFPSLALMLPNGLIAVNDDHRDRVVLISRKLNRIVWQYGHTDRPGTAPSYLNTPDGMDFLPFDVAMSMPDVRSLVLNGR